MKSISAAGIIAEYNPFHTGHLFQLREAGRAEGYTIAVMSGNAVQRGGPAFFSKWDRARAAVLSGADLVLELPAVWASAPAERFAGAGVGLLAGTGCVSTLSCGSESGDAGALWKAAGAVMEAERSPVLTEMLGSGMTYAAARERSVEALFGQETAGLLNSPNDILAIEYCKAIRMLSAPIGFSTVLRRGAGHDSDTLLEQTASASLLRRLLAEGKTEQAFRFIPEGAQEIFSRALTEGRFAPSTKALDRAVLYRLMTVEADALREVPDVSEGLENRLIRAAEETESVSGLLEAVKTKRYTMSRLRRIVWNLMLGNTRALTLSHPPYLRVLAFEKDRGREILGQIKKNSSLPLYHSMAQLERDFPAYAAVEKRASMLWGLCCPEPVRENEYPKNEPVQRTINDKERNLSHDLCCH